MPNFILKPNLNLNLALYCWIPPYSSVSVSFYRMNYFCLFEMAVIDQKGIQASAAAIFHVFCLDPLSFLRPDEKGRNQLMAQLIRIWDLLSRYNIKYIWGQFGQQLNINYWFSGQIQRLWRCGLWQLRMPESLNARWRLVKCPTVLQFALSGVDEPQTEPYISPLSPRWVEWAFLLKLNRWASVGWLDDHCKYFCLCQRHCFVIRGEVMFQLLSPD